MITKCTCCEAPPADAPSAPHAHANVSGAQDPAKVFGGMTVADYARAKSPAGQPIKRPCSCGKVGADGAPRMCGCRNPAAASQQRVACSCNKG